MLAPPGNGPAGAGPQEGSARGSQVLWSTGSGVQNVIWSCSFSAQMFQYAAAWVLCSAAGSLVAECLEETLRERKVVLLVDVVPAKMATRRDSVVIEPGMATSTLDEEHVSQNNSLRHGSECFPSTEGQTYAKGLYTIRGLLTGPLIFGKFKTLEV